MTSQRIIIVTDAWEPQVNGVVTTLKGLAENLKNKRHTVDLIHPGLFKTIPLPMYPEIRIARNPWKIKEILTHAIVKTAKPTNVHIATEGPLGLFARRYCVKNNIPFTTSYHTNFPEFISEFTKIPTSWIYPVVRWFHKPAKSILVTTKSMRTKLTEQQFENLVVWNRAVDTKLFHPDKTDPLLFEEYEPPIYINVGRVSPEKNLRAFLDLPLPGTKVIVGDGPAMKELKRDYPLVKFVGVKKGEQLAKHFASADVFVFPSLTDTFGLVMIESMACGTPVAAYPVTGPIDVVVNGTNGSMNENLLTACHAAGVVDRDKTRQHVVENHDWDTFAQIFLDTLVDI